jgi:hypothetical protein
MSRNRRRNGPSGIPEASRPTSLEPKPPAILQNIAWFFVHWREHKLVIAIAIFFVGAPAAYSVVSWWPKSAGESTAATLNASKKSLTENSSPALRVQFRDGVVGYVELSFAFAVDPSSVVDVYRNYGSQQRAVADLRDAVEGAVYKSMEKLTINEARQNRGQIEASIVELTKDQQKHTGHTIYRVSLCRPNNKQAVGRNRFIAPLLAESTKDSICGNPRSAMRFAYA